MYLRQSQETDSLQKVDIAEAIPQSSEAVFTGKLMKNFFLRTSLLLLYAAFP